MRVVEDAMLRAAIVIAVLGMSARAAYPCMNVPELEGNEAVQRIVQVEAYLSVGAYGAAESELDAVYFTEAHIRQRATDVHMVVYLRLKPQRNAKQAIQYFTARSKYEPKNVRFKMYLAEAYAANRQSKEALEILTDLDKRDLMPDSFGYLTLAKLSDGADQDRAIDLCKKRAKAKNLCVLSKPLSKAIARPAKPQNRMRLE